MLSSIKNLLGMRPKVDFKGLVSNGALIIDVRTPGEFQSGHIKGSINMPLQSLQSQLSKMAKDKVIITCCASGIRSANAKTILKSNGFKVVHNGGGWQSLASKIK